MRKFAEASRAGANLLLNTGPRADGSIEPAHANVLREMGRRIREQVWPA